MKQTIFSAPHGSNRTESQLFGSSRLGANSLAESQSSNTHSEALHFTGTSFMRFSCGPEATCSWANGSRRSDSGGSGGSLGFGIGLGLLCFGVIPELLNALCLLLCLSFRLLEIDGFRPANLLSTQLRRFLSA